MGDNKCVACNLPLIGNGLCCECRVESVGDLDKILSRIDDVSVLLDGLQKAVSTLRQETFHAQKLLYPKKGVV